MAQFGLKTIHMHVPPMGFIDDPEQVQTCVDFVLDHPARYVFFIVGSPRSEYVTRLVHQSGKAVGTGLCVGSSLHFLTGLTKRANATYRKLGLEWLHRLIENPRSHASRVFVDSMPIFLIAAKARLNPAAYGMGARPPGHG
jgi:exopolysaccharide biosynthesis WecB/TagA/CpsF family protein